MNVKDAIALMAKHPSVIFPWEGTLVGLINGFLPAETQLDPHTAEAPEVQSAIDSLESSLQAMVYETQLGPGQIPYAPPVPLQAPVAPVPLAGDHRQAYFIIFGLFLCLIAVILTFKIGNGATGSDVVEVLRIILQLLKDPYGPPAAPADPS